MIFLSVTKVRKPKNTIDPMRGGDHGGGGGGGGGRAIEVIGFFNSLSCRSSLSGL